MSDEPSTRRLGIAIATAAATTTLAVGVTAASLFGVLGPARKDEAPPPASAEPTPRAPETKAAPPVILVPVAPATEPPSTVEPPASPAFEGDEGDGERLAMRRFEEDDDEHEHHHEDDDDD